MATGSIIAMAQRLLEERIPTLSSFRFVVEGRKQLSSCWIENEIGAAGPNLSPRGDHPTPPITTY